MTSENRETKAPEAAKPADLDLDQLDNVAGGRKPPPTTKPKPGDPCAGGE